MFLSKRNADENIVTYKRHWGEIHYEVIIYTKTLRLVKIDHQWYILIDILFCYSKMNINYLRLPL